MAAHNLGALRDLAFQPGGFGLDDALRLRCWGALVAVDFESLPPLDVASAAETSSHGDRGTVAKDVNRSLWAAGERRGWSEKVRNKRRRALARVVNATFDESQHYYQGFHDVAAVVLDVAGFDPSGERRALAICRALARRRLSDACRKDFSDVSTSLKLLPALVHALDGELGRLLFRPDDLDYALLLEPLWALSWAVTLFAHNVDDTSLVVLWDRLLAAPPCFPLYVGAALVVHHRESLIATATEDDAAPFLHGALSKLPGLTSGPAWDSIATSARRLLATTPPARAVARAPRRLRPYLAPVRDVVRTPYFFGRAAPDGPTLLSAAPASAPAAAPSRRRNGRRRRRRDDQPLAIVPARRQRVVVARRFSVAVALAAILGGLVTENALLRAFLEDPTTWARALVQNLLA